MEIKTQRDQTIKFVEENLKECCKEILQWHKTALLCDGKVRQANELCNKWYGRDSLTFIERTVENLAMKRIAEKE